MQIQVTGKKVELGEALKARIIQDLGAGILKYFERGGSAEVTVAKQGHLFRVDCWVRLASGQTLISHGEGSDAHQAFDKALDTLENRIGRYKRRLKNHKSALNGVMREELVSMTVLSSTDEDGDWEDNAASDLDGPPQALIIAETEASLRTLSVAQAVAEMDLSNYPVLMFRNAAHKGLSVIYRRPDGNIGWIDPERTIKK